MTPSIPATLCDPFEGAHLLSTAPITGIFGAPIPANVRLVAGEIDSAEQQRFLTVTGRSPLGMAVEANVWEEDWDRLILLLDSPLALCHAARWLAARLGMEPGATAPGWAQYPCGEHCCNGETGEMAACTRPVWSLGTDEGFVLFMDCPNPEAWDGEECRHVPGISDLTDPAEALAAACVAVGGAS